MTKVDYLSQMREMGMKLVELEQGFYLAQSKGKSFLLGDIMKDDEGNYMVPQTIMETAVGICEQEVGNGLYIVPFPPHVTSN